MTARRRARRPADRDPEVAGPVVRWTVRVVLAAMAGLIVLHLIWSWPG